MKLINQTKTKFITSKGDFRINAIANFDDAEGRTLLRYEGINKISDLEEGKDKKDSKKKN